MPITLTLTDEQIGLLQDMLETHRDTCMFTLDEEERDGNHAWANATLEALDTLEALLDTPREHDHRDLAAS